MTQVKLQTYMDRHKLGPLFEDLMNKVLRDMPEEPLIYLLRALYKKTGMEIPQDIRYGGLRKSVDLGRSRSPERAARPPSGVADQNSVTASREYDKPWQVLQKHTKSRHSSDGVDVSPTKSGKKKPDWQSDTKIVSASFDDLWENRDTHQQKETTGKKSSAQNEKRSSWAAFGLENGETFVNGSYQGPCPKGLMSLEDLLAAENIRSSGRDIDSSISQQTIQTHAASGVSRGIRSDHERHRQKLESILTDTTVGQTQPAPPLLQDPDSDVEDEAIELLEDADDLRREGVKNISGAGYKLSKIMRERSNEPHIQLNINLSPRAGGDLKLTERMLSFEGYDSDRENTSRSGGKSESDDEFESVSQVNGPRVPVWQVPDSDVETSVRHDTKRKHRRHQGSRELAATALSDCKQLTPRAADFDPTQTCLPGLVQTEEGAKKVELERDVDMTSVDMTSAGWDVPEDSDAASVQDWNQRVKGARRDPRVY